LAVRLLNGASRSLESLGLVTPRTPDASERTAWREKISEALFGVHPSTETIETQLTPTAPVTGEPQATHGKLTRGAADRDTIGETV